MMKCNLTLCVGRLLSGSSVQVIRGSFEREIGKYTLTRSESIAVAMGVYFIMKVVFTEQTPVRGS